MAPCGVDKWGPCEKCSGMKGCHSEGLAKLRAGQLLCWPLAHLLPQTPHSEQGCAEPRIDGSLEPAVLSSSSLTATSEQLGDMRAPQAPLPRGQSTAFSWCFSGTVTWFLVA